MAVNIGDLVARLRADLSQWERGFSDAERTARTFTDRFGRILQTGIGVSVGLVATQIARDMGRAIGAISKLGLEAKVQEAAFARLAAAGGQSSERLIARLQAASGAIIDVSDAMRAASRAIVQGFDETQIVRLMETARQLAKVAGKDVVEAFNDITVAVTTGMTRQLKATYGVVIDAEQAVKDFAAANHQAAENITEQGKAQAILAALFKASAGTVAALTSEVRTEGEEVQRLSSAWQQLRQNIGIAIPHGEIAATLTMLIDALRGVKGELDAVLDALRPWKDLWDSTVAVLKVVGTVIATVLSVALAGLNVALGSTLGVLAAIASVMGDLSQGRLPDLAKAWNANLAIMERYVATAKGLVGLPTPGSAPPDAEAAREAARLASLQLRGAAPAAPSAFAGPLFRPIEADVKGLVSAMETLRGAFREVEQAGALDKTAAQVEEFLDRLRQVPGVTEAVVDAMRPWAESIVARTVEIRALKESTDLLNEAQVAMMETEDALTERGRAVVGGLGPDAQARADLMRDLDALRDQLHAQQAALAATGDAAVAAGESYLRFGVAIGEVDEGSRAWLETLAKTRSELAATNFTQKVKDLNAVNTILGRGFDATGKTFDVTSEKIALITEELKRLAAASGGEATPRIVELKDELAGLQQFQSLKGMFQDIFGSVSGAISKAVEGVILGTQKMKDAFRNLGQYIIAEFAARVIRQALNPIVDALANLAAGLGQVLLSALGSGIAAAGGGASGGAAGGGVYGSAISVLTSAGVSSAGGGLAQGLFGGAGFGSSLASAFPGIANLGMNFAQGGATGALVGLTQAQAANLVYLDAFNFALAQGATEVQALAYAANAASGVESGTAGLAGASGAASGLSVALAAVGVAANLAFAGLALSEGRLGAGVGGVVGTVAGAIVGQILIPIPVVGALIGGAVGGALGGLLGGLFDQDEIPHEVREALETERVLGQAAGFQRELFGAQNLAALYGKITAYQSGYVGGTSALAVPGYFPNVPVERLQALVTGGQVLLPGGETSAAAYAQRAGYAQGGYRGVPVFPGAQNANYPVFSGMQSFFDFLRENEDLFAVGIQAGVTPGNLTEANQILRDAILGRLEFFDQLQEDIQAALDEILASTVTPPDVDTFSEALTHAAALFGETLTTLREHAQANIDAARAELLTITDPRAFLDQVQVIRGLIEDRYQGEITLVQRWAGQMQQIAAAWNQVSDAMEAQQQALRLSGFGPTNPSERVAVVQQGFTEALTAFRAEPTIELAQQLSALAEPFLQAASEQFTRPSGEFRAIFAQVQAALEEVRTFSTARQAEIDAAITAALPRTLDAGGLAAAAQALLQAGSFQQLGLRGGPAADPWDVAVAAVETMRRAGVSPTYVSGSLEDIYQRGGTRPTSLGPYTPGGAASTVTTIEQARLLVQQYSDLFLAQFGTTVTLDELIAGNTEQMANDLSALLEETTALVTGMGWIFDPAYGQQQLTDAQVQIALLAQIAQNTLPGSQPNPAAERQRLAEQFAQSYPGLANPYSGAGPGFPTYQHGGTFTVGGAGGPDSELVRFLATPGETVRVTPRGEVPVGAGVLVQVGDIHVTGAADPEATARAVVDVLERRLRAPGRLRAAVRDVAKGA